MQLFVLFCFLCVVYVKSVPVRKKGVDVVQPCGTEASGNPLHHNPWLVYLEYFDERGLRGIRCAGSLITSRHVVTAAHCLRNVIYTSLVARLGEYDVTKEVDVIDDVTADPVVHIEVASVRIHEGYDGSKDDIAILVLKEDAPYTDFIRPICLPTQASKKGDIYSASGWGEITSTHIYSNTKKNIYLPSWSLEDCKQVYKRWNLPENVICAGGEEDIDTCRGDSGGPLTLSRERVELHGVTSSGNVVCGTKGFPGIYTSVLGHLGWIKHVINITGR